MISSGLSPEPGTLSISDLDEQCEQTRLEAALRQRKRGRFSRLASFFLRLLRFALKGEGIAIPLSDTNFAYQWRVVRPEFDAKYYRKFCPDVARAGIDPLSHFLDYGWHEGRDPNASFSVKQYLETNVDVARAEINPFYHYLGFGRREGRRAKFEDGYRQTILENVIPISERIASVAAFPRWKISPAESLRRAIGSATRSNRRRVCISVSHDNVAASIGGIQFCVVREAEAFETAQVDHIHLFPGRDLFFTDRETEDPVIGVFVNGPLAGYFKASTIVAVFEEAVGPVWAERTLAIHSMLGHNSRSLAAIAGALRVNEAFFWIHDFASVCANFDLLRNDVAACGAPPLESLACEICIYGERRRIQVEDHAHLFENLAVTVIAPSRFALASWKASAGLQARDEHVHPHCRLTARASLIRSLGEVTGALRVAFLGYRKAPKGWLVFQDLVKRFGADERYEFYHLGIGPQPDLPVHFKRVSVGAQPPNEMITAIDELQIDVALIWSLKPETFCFTAHEALAAGAAVITTKRSGHVTDLIDRTGIGRTLEDEHELRELFEAGTILELRRSRRPVERFDLEYSHMTADFVNAPAS